MIKYDLLNKELEEYRTRGNDLKSVKYNKNHVYNLFKKYSNYEMTEVLYEHDNDSEPSWIEVIEEGIWGLSLKKVKSTILNKLFSMQDILRSRRKYGNRFYMYQNKDHCLIYIYARDLLLADYIIWFDNRKYI